MKIVWQLKSIEVLRTLGSESDHQTSGRDRYIFYTGKLFESPRFFFSFFSFLRLSVTTLCIGNRGQILRLTNLTKSLHLYPSLNIAIWFWWNMHMITYFMLTIIAIGVAIIAQANRNSWARGLRIENGKAWVEDMTISNLSLAQMVRDLVWIRV